MNSRVCSECGRTFQPSSGHLRCPSCRSRVLSYDLCACGARKHRQSSTCAACRTEKGASNSNWKGGQTWHKRGYLMTWVPGHPRAGKGSYVFEHILVMEKMIGRYLLPGENVHHRNGVRDDNRPENLELWTSPQPAGVRAGDAVAWAREILARYEGKLDALGITGAMASGSDKAERADG
jgi:HNH endonuclease